MPDYKLLSNTTFPKTSLYENESYGNVNVILNINNIINLKQQLIKLYEYDNLLNLIF